MYRANKEMYEVFYEQYKNKKNKTNESKIICHFTEEDSKNRIHPMRLKGSNPYLLWSNSENNISFQSYFIHLTSTFLFPPWLFVS